MNKIIVVVGVTVAMLAGCAAKPAEDKASSTVSKSNASNEKMTKQIADFEKMKPSLQRLVAMEGDLKELITQLNTMVKQSDSDSTTAMETDTTQPVKTNKLDNAVPIPTKVKSVSAKLPDVSSTDLAKSSIEHNSQVIKTKATSTLSSVKPFSVQLSSIKDLSTLNATWNDLKTSFPALLSGLRPVYQKVSVKQDTYYRIKAGSFSTLHDANKLCEKLQSSGGHCFATNSKGVVIPNE